MKKTILSVIILAVFGGIFILAAGVPTSTKQRVTPPAFSIINTEKAVPKAAVSDKNTTAPYTAQPTVTRKTKTS